MLELFIKKIGSEAQNCIPVSILSNLAKLYGECLFNEVATHFDDIFFQNTRKGFSSQQCLIVLLKKCKKLRDRGGSSAVLLTDLSKAFNFLLYVLQNKRSK